MSKSELEDLFLALWRRLHPGLPEPEREYCFAREIIGDNPHPPARPGLRERL